MSRKANTVTVKMENTPIDTVEENKEIMIEGDGSEENKTSEVLDNDSTTSGENLTNETIETEVEIGDKEPLVDTVVESIAAEEVNGIEDKKTTSDNKYNKNIDYEGRGFTSLTEAIAFIDTEYFKHLGKEDRDEYLNWLKK